MMKKIWTSIKVGTWKCFGAIFTDTKADGKVGVSMGRVSFVFVMVVLAFLWFKSLSKGEAIPMPNGLMEVFYVLAGYVLGTKGFESIRGYLEAKKK